jgi:hypothetical protein
MKNIEVLEWGLQHIAANYKMGASTEDLQSEAEGCIYVTEEHPDVSPAPVNDVQMLCDDLGIDRAYMKTSEFGIEVTLDWQWPETIGQEEYTPTGHEMWKRFGVEIGS